ncbi:putative dihydrolipoamide acetyltransferase [Escherichia coli 2850750]|nr:putative dihydrolipoamide acetyltransferase [Escherichia coli 2850750]
MIFRHGDMKKWKGVGYDFEIVKAEELQEYLDAGWFAHPDDLLKDVAEPEPEPEPEPEEKQRKKPGRKPKAAADEPDNEGGFSSCGIT